MAEQMLALNNVTAKNPVIDLMVANYSILPSVQTSDQLCNFLYNWINKVLNINKGLSVPIIQSHQNAPFLQARHIVIEYAPGREKFGCASKTTPAQAPEESGDVEEGTVFSVEDYECAVDIREENGNGDYLSYIIESIELPEIMEYFFKNKIAYLGNGNIMPVPRLNDSEWIKEAVVEIRLGIPTFQQYISNTIDTVDYTFTPE